MADTDPKTLVVKALLSTERRKARDSTNAEIDGLASQVGLSRETLGLYDVEPKTYLALLQDRLDKLRGRTKGRPKKPIGLDMIRAGLAFELGHGLTALKQGRGIDYSKPVTVSSAQIALVIKELGFSQLSLSSTEAIYKSIERGRKKLGLNKYYQPKRDKKSI